MLDGIPVLDYAPETLLGIFILLLFIGRVVPYWYIKKMEDRIASLEEANKALIEQNGELLETSRLARSTWMALSEGVRDL